MVNASDYTSGDLAISKRDDLEYNLSATLGYSFNGHISANLVYSFHAGRNDLAGVVDPQTRAFNQNLVSIGMLIKF